MVIADVSSTISVVTAVGGLALTAFGYVGYQNRRERLSAIRSTFDGVVEALAAEDHERRLAAAVLLRRFFDENSELGIALPAGGRRAPYAQEALDVIAAVLRGLETGNFQKLLADGIAFAPDLHDADLQKTNLQNAYLVPRRHWVSLERADFFRADLSGASLKGASAREVVFLQARLGGTVLKNADLRKANFGQAELAGAQFGGAKLLGADFSDARDVPEELLEFIAPDGIYSSDEPAPGRVVSSGAARRVFLSIPSRRSPEDDVLLQRFARVLDGYGLVPEELPRSEYPSFGALAEVRRRMTGCCGAVIFGFGQLRVGDTELPTPWNQIEAGMAYVLDLPLLLVAPAGAAHGIFDTRISEQSVYRLPPGSTASADSLDKAIAEWASAALARAGHHA